MDLTKNKNDFYNAFFSFILTVLSLLPARGYIRPDILVAMIVLFSFITGKSLLINKRWFNFCTMTFFLTYIFMCFFHFSMSVSFTWIYQFVMRFFFVPLVIYRKMNSVHTVECYLKLIVIFGFLYSILGLFEAFYGYNLFESIYGYTIERYAANDIRFGINRSFGFFTISINNGMFMCMIWCISNYLLCSERKKKKASIFLFIVWGVVGLYTILILSKSVLIVAVISQIILFLKNDADLPLRKKIIRFIIISVCFIIFINSGTVLGKYFTNMYIPVLNQIVGLSVAYDEEYSAGGAGERFVLYSWVLESMNGHYLFGVGLEQKFSYTFVKISEWGNRSRWVKESIENTWLYYLFRMGFVGMFSFIIYQFGCLKSIIQILKLEARHYSLSFLMLILTIGYFILLLTCFGQEDLKFFYILFAIYIAYGGLKSNKLVK